MTQKKCLAYILIISGRQITWCIHRQCVCFQTLYLFSPISLTMCVLMYSELGYIIQDKLNKTVSCLSTNTLTHNTIYNRKASILYSQCTRKGSTFFNT